EPRDTLAKNIVAGLAHAPGMEDQTPQQTNMPPQGAPAGPPSGPPIVSGTNQPPQGDGNLGPVGQNNPNAGPGSGVPAPPQPVNPPANQGAAVGSLNGTWKS